MTGQRNKTRTSPAKRHRQGCSAVRAEFHRLCAASRRRLPLFRGPEVLSSRRTLLRARRRDRKRRQRACRNSTASSAGISARQGRRGPQAADRTPLCRAGVAFPAGTVAGYWASLGLPPGIAGTKSRQLPRARSIDRRAGRGRTRRRPERARRPRRQAFARPDGHAGERLSRSATGRIEPAARIGQDALAAGAAFRRFSAGGTRVQPGRDRLLDLPVRSHDPQPRGQGISRPRTGARRSRFHRLPATPSGKAPSSLPPSKSPRRSPPVFAPNCAITSSATICWARPSPSITWRTVRNVRPAATRNCATRAGRRADRDLAPAPSW